MAVGPLDTPPNKPLPLTPLDKAVQGLNFRAGEITHTITALRQSVGSSPRIVQLLNKIGIGPQAKVIKALSQEQKLIGKMVTILGHKPSISVYQNLPPALPNTIAEVNEKLESKEQEISEILDNLKEVRQEISNLDRDYHDAVVYHAIAEAGLAKTEPQEYKNTLADMDTLKATLKGLEHAQLKVEREIKELEDQYVSLIQDKDEAALKAIENIEKRISNKVLKIEDQIIQKTKQVEQTFFLARRPLKQQIAQLQHQKSAAKNDLEQLRVMKNSETFDQTILRQAQETLEGATDEGQITLLGQIIDYTEQMGKDIGRLGSLRIGKESFTVEQREGKEPAELCTMFARSIRDHVASKNPKLKIYANTMNEILATTMQNFFSPVTVLSHADSRIPFTEWGADKGDTRSSTTFEMEKTHLRAPTTLVITRQFDKKYQYVGEDRTLEGQTKDMTLQVQCSYNLESKEVEFIYTYTLDGSSKTWEPTKDPFKAKLDNPWASKE